MHVLVGPDLATVKQEDATEHAVIGPVADDVGDAVGVLLVFSVEAEGEERGRGRDDEEPGMWSVVWEDLGSYRGDGVGVLFF